MKTLRDVKEGDILHRAEQLGGVMVMEEYVVEKATDRWIHMRAIHDGSQRRMMRTVKRPHARPTEIEAVSDLWWRQDYRQKKLESQLYSCKQAQKEAVAYFNEHRDEHDGFIFACSVCGAPMPDGAMPGVRCLYAEYCSGIYMPIRKEE